MLEAIEFHRLILSALQHLQCSQLLRGHVGTALCLISQPERGRCGLGSDSRCQLRDVDGLRLALSHHGTNDSIRLSEGLIDGYLILSTRKLTILIGKSTLLIGLLPHVSHLDSKLLVDLSLSLSLLRSHACAVDLCR